MEKRVDFEGVKMFFLDFSAEFTYGLVNPL